MGQITFLCREYSCSRVVPQATSSGAIPAGTIAGSIAEVDIVKILGVDVAILET